MSDLVTSVLIVDDNEVDRYLLRRCLNRVKPRPHISEVNCAEQALAFFKERSLLQEGTAASSFSEVYLPSIVFLDINMPVMNGLDFLDEFALLRSQFTHIACKVIMCSTARRADEERRAMAHPFVKGYFSKGDVNDELLSEIIAENSIVPSVNSGDLLDTRIQPGLE